MKYGGVTMILDCHNMDFSIKSSQKRILYSNEILGTDITKRILCFSLYLLGASRASISSSLQTSADTIKSLIKRIYLNGLLALEDRRYRYKGTISTSSKQKKETFCISIEGDYVKITLGLHEQCISIPTENRIQLKILLLTLLNAGLVATQDVSQVLGYSENHVRFLNKKLHDEGIDGLIDKRQGQQQHYRFTSDVKSQLILQFILDVATEGKTSGKLLSEHIKERSELDLSARSIRHHVKRLGLAKIKREVLVCLSNLKKTLPDN